MHLVNEYLVALHLDMRVLFDCLADCSGQLLTLLGLSADVGLVAVYGAEDVFLGALRGINGRIFRSFVGDALVEDRKGTGCLVLD